MIGKPVTTRSFRRFLTASSPVQTGTAIVLTVVLVSGSYSPSVSCQDLPSSVRLEVEALHGIGDGAAAGNESNGEAQASVYQPILELPPHESAVYARLHKDEATQLDELIEALDTELSSSEIFAALFELELTGRVRMMPGKNYVKSF